MIIELEPNDVGSSFKRYGFDLAILRCGQCVKVFWKGGQDRLGVPLEGQKGSRKTLKNWMGATVFSSLTLYKAHAPAKIDSHSGAQDLSQELVVAKAKAQIGHIIIYG